MLEHDLNFENAVNILNNQKKELECLYKIDNILQDSNTELEKILKQLVAEIPLWWQYSDICRVKIKVYNINVESENFKKTDKFLFSNLVVDDEIVGDITISYLKSANSDKLVFLDVENRLFKTIVEKISRSISYRKLKNFFIERTNYKEQLYKEENSFIKYLKELSLKDNEIDKIIKVPIDLKKDEVICKQGSFASFVMILKEGLLKSYVENSHNKNHIFKIAKPYSIIGLSSLYGDIYCHFTCSAVVNSKLYIIERSTFNEIIKNNPKFAIKIMNIYSNSLQNVYDKIGTIANKQALGKVCDTLTYLSEKVFESNIIDRVITRKDIADFSGLSTENLIRILADLKKDNIISINNKVIEILKPETIKMLGHLG